MTFTSWWWTRVQSFTKLPRIRDTATQGQTSYYYDVATTSSCHIPLPPAAAWTITSCHQFPLMSEWNQWPSAMVSQQQHHLQSSVTTHCHRSSLSVISHHCPSLVITNLSSSAVVSHLQSSPVVSSHWQSQVIIPSLMLQWLWHHLYWLHLSMCSLVLEWWPKVTADHSMCAVHGSMMA